MKTTLSNSAENILLMGFFFTPFTSLRFGLLGPGEILILAAAIIAVVSGRGKLKLDLKIQNLYRFWVFFLAFSMLGMHFNNFFISSPSGRPGTPFFDFSAYIFILTAIVLIGHYSHDNDDFPKIFFRRLFLYWSLTYVSLYAISFFTASIFGLPLRYHRFFSPLVENVHQAASITCAMGFITLFLGMRSSGFHVKVFYFICTALFVKMALDSGSTKAMLAVTVGAIVSVISLIFYRPTGQGRRFLNVVSFLLVGISIVWVYAQYSYEIYFLAGKFFSESDGGGAREALYSVGFEHGSHSLLIGYGPGSHAPYAGGFSDAHNTILTIFLQSGLLGVLVFVFLVGRLLQKLSVNFALLGAMVAIGMYILGGDILRRLPTWIMIIGLIYFAADLRVRSSISVHQPTSKPNSRLKTLRQSAV